ncbi:hypothetical protein Tco_1177978, partial [Tanacetum coccineum]
MESVLHISKSPAKSQVEFATCMLQGRALKWWNNLVQARGQAAAMALPWEDLKKLFMEYFISTNFLPLINVKPSVIGLNYEIEIASFDVIVGIDWLSKLKAKIVYYDKIVQILLSNGEILEVHKERPEGNLRHLKTMKADEQKLKDIPVVRNFPSMFPMDLQ